MFFRLLNIFIVIVTISFSQTFHSRNLFISSETMTMSSKGNSMGNTGMMIDNNAFWTFSNPAALSGLKGVNVSFKSSMHRFKEHRSIKVHDYFGDFLADASYVFNDDNYFNKGIAVSFPFYSDNVMIGLSNIPFHNFNYSYIEEVHDASYDLNKDPLVGYHIENFSGLLYNMTCGFGWGIKDLSFGFSYNQIHSGNKFLNSPILLDRIKSVIVLDESNNLASTETYADTSFISLKTSNFITYGFMANIKKNIIFSFQHRESVNTMEKNHLKYAIPSKSSIGILLKPRQEVPASIVFEYDIQSYSTIDSIFNNPVSLNDKKTYHFGIEYVSDESAIRAGMIYQNSPFQRDLDEAIITLGYGRIIQGVEMDLSANYSTISYSYADQFIPNGDISNSDQFEKITEANIGLSVSLSYNFR